MQVIEKAVYNLQLTQTEVDVIALALSQLSAKSINKWCSDLPGQFHRIASGHLIIRTNEETIPAIEFGRLVETD